MLTPPSISGVRVTAASSSTSRTLARALLRDD